jgi:broad specificity phosphatase PhoE
MTTVYLIRHGEISQSKKVVFVGQRNLLLTDRGREQIARLADFLASRAISKVLCSPLSRCVESAGILCSSLGGVPETVPGLQEISLGAWEGLSVDEIQALFPGCYEARGRNLAEFRPSGGESFDDLLNRVWPIFETIVHGMDERIAIVAHAGVNRVILCRILNIPLENLLRLEQYYGCLNVIHHTNSGYRVESINSCPWPAYDLDSSSS